MNKSTTRAAADIADEALELLENTREQLDMLASLLRAIYWATPAALATLSNHSRSGALDAQHLAGLGELSARLNDTGNGIRDRRNTILRED